MAWKSFGKGKIRKRKKKRKGKISFERVLNVRLILMVFVYFT